MGLCVHLTPKVYSQCLRERGMMRRGAGRAFRFRKIQVVPSI